MMIHRFHPGRGARLRKVLALAALKLMLLGMLGCEDSLVSVQEPVASVQVQSPVTTLVAGDSLSLQVVLRSAGGQVLTGRTITWMSSDSSVVLVRASGRVMARRAGTATVTAASEGRTGSVSVTVASQAHPLPSVNALLPAQAYQGDAGAEVVIHGTGFMESSQVHWNGSARPSVVVGSTQIRVTLTAVDLAAAQTASIEVVNPAPGGGRSQPQTFVVVPRPGPVGTALVITPDPLILLAGMDGQVTARFVDAQGNTVPGTPQVTWWTGDPEVATVGATGQVSAVKAGETRVYAAGQGFYTSSVVTVRPLPAGPRVLYQSAVTDMAGQVVDTIVWTPEGGAPVKAQLVVRVARIMLDHQTASYVQEFQAYVMAGSLSLATTGWMEHGSWRYDFMNGGQMVFTPDGGGAEFRGNAGGVGVLRVAQRVRKAALVDYFEYVVREETP